METNDKKAGSPAWGLAMVYVLCMTLAVIAVSVAYYLGAESVGWPPISLGQLTLYSSGLWAALCILVPGVMLSWKRLMEHQAERTSRDVVQSAVAALKRVAEPRDDSWPRTLQRHLASHHGPFWRRKVRILLVVGEADQVNAIAPRLTADRWIEGRDTVWIWGGSLQADIDDATTALYRSVRPTRPLDGVVWAMDTALSADANHLAAGMRRLRRLARDLHWSLPLHLWQVRRPFQAVQANTQPVGCLLPHKQPIPALRSGLTDMLPRLVAWGVHQVITQQTNDFYLRLSHDLEHGGIDRWCDTLQALPAELAKSVPLRGVWFSLPLERVQTASAEPWQVEPAWNGVLDDHPRQGRWIARHPLRMASYALTALSALWALGMLASFTTNRIEIAQVNAALTQVQPTESGDTQLHALNELMHRLARLDQPTPWYQTFGLDTRPVLRANLWPRYVEANNRLIRDPAAALLETQLDKLVQLPPDSPLRGQAAHTAYQQLKAYLMMASPDKAAPAFMVKVLTDAQPERAGVTPGVWQYLAPPLWQFYARHLPEHPDWRIEADPQRVAGARKVLLTELGQRNGEIALYAQVLEQAGHHYAALELSQMVGDTDPAMLFSTHKSVPGVFTRQAWEGHIRQAINQIASARREQIDWVLSDQQGDIAPDLSPEVLKQRLTERYFRDYADAWQGFLNSLRWHAPLDLSASVEQLALVSDTRQSPLIALVNTLAYQGRAGTQGQAIADSLLHSAQQLLGSDKVPAIDQRQQGPSGPLDATFGPLLALVDKDAGPDHLTLQGYLNRVSRVRLTLAQVAESHDKHAMTQSLAQNIFQGNNDDLTETQGYGRLVAASLGEHWNGLGKTLFVEPLATAWERILQPSAQALNTQWERAIVEQWNTAFVGRYPFAGTDSDASLAMLGQMIRSDSGRIDQFLRQQLAGVLHKQGGRWGVDKRHSQALKVNPAFLAAVNQLGHLADVLYTDGGMNLGFELSGKPVKDVVETTFVLDGQTHEYYNQRERWQRFRWPGLSPQPGTRVTWINVFNDNRQTFGDYQGVWGLIRWLEQAQVTPLNDEAGRYRLVFTAPDGLGLTWHLRTEMGEGPLTLLKLRGFTLPAQIFLTRSEPGRQAALSVEPEETVL